MTSQITTNSGVIPDPYVNGVSVVTYDKETDKVSMPLWYWKKIVRYFIDSQTVKNNVHQDEGNP